jgi:hypothetical protein
VGEHELVFCAAEKFAPKVSARCLRRLRQEIFGMTKNHLVLFSLTVSLLLAGCGSGDKAAKARSATVTTRWKWNSQSAVAADKGLIIEQTGDAVETTFVHLKESGGFEVDQTISRGRYDVSTRQIVIPPAHMTPAELDMAINMDVPRVAVQFTPEAQVLKAKWIGKGCPNLSMDFVRVPNSTAP